MALGGAPLSFCPLVGLRCRNAPPGAPGQKIPPARAGPAANFLLALWFGGLLIVLNQATAFRPVLSGEALLPSLFWSNLYLGLFNLIPAYPLDGGRVLRAWWGRRMDYIDAPRRAVVVGETFALLFRLHG